MIKIYTEPEAYLVALTRPLEKNIHEYLTKYDYPIKDYKNFNDLIEFAGRHCYMSFANQKNDLQKTKEFVEARFAQNHTGLAEHVAFSIVLRGISRGFTHEAVRHRLMSYAQASTRYCAPNIFGVVRPKLFNDLPEFCQKRFEEMIQSQYNLYDEAMDMFEKYLPYETTLKTKRGQARSFLTNMIEAPIYISANLRSWKEMRSKRVSPQAELEFQAVIAAIDKVTNNIDIC